MPANKYALLRYRIIDRAIGNKYKRYPNKEDLRRICEEKLYGSDGDRVSLSTIDKDLYAMRNESYLGYFAPIKFSKYHDGYYYEDPEYSIDNLPLSEEDADAIRFAATTLFQFKEIDLFKTYESAIIKILDRLNLSDNGDTAEEFIQYEKAPVYRGNEFLGTILKAIQTRKILSFSYEKFSGGGANNYTLHPYLLKEYRNRWYVIGLNPAKDLVVVFGLDRITQLTVSEESYQMSKDFDPDRFFKYSLGITTGTGSPQRIRVKVEWLTAEYLVSQPLHHSQKVVSRTKEYTTFEFTLIISQELIMQLLSYGPNIEVLEPSGLRQNLKQQLQEALSRY